MSTNSHISTKNVHTMLNPKSVAVIAASDEKGSIGYTIFENLIKSKFQGDVFAVNPNYDKVQGYASMAKVTDIDSDVDLAVIATPASTVAEILNQCAEKKIQSAVILSAGFKEAGEKGTELYKEIKEICDKNNIRAIGPNCMGLINPWIDLNLGFYSRPALQGNLAFISQSGALSSSILDWAVDQSVGFSGFVSIGSMMDVNFSDLIEYFEEDENTDIILLYIESLLDGERFLEVASRVSSKKPILAIKSGHSDLGAKVAASHTGALTANDMIYDAAFESSGVLRVYSVGELFRLAKGFSTQPFPKGTNLAIVSNAGGPAVMATDQVVKSGVNLASLSDQTVEELKKLLPYYANTNNPIDVLGNASASTFAKSVDLCLNDEGVDGIIAIFTTQGVTDPTEAAQAFVDNYKPGDKPVLACWMGEGDVKEAREILEKARIPNYRYPGNTVKVFAKMVQYTTLQERPQQKKEKGEYDCELAKTIIQYAGVQDRERLTELEAKQILNCYGIATPNSVLATDVMEAEYEAVKLGFPVVMKIVSPDIGHKIDVGGVVLNIKDYHEAEDAYNNLISNVTEKAPDVEIMGVLVEKMVDKRYELLIGAVRDKTFGPAIVFGMGGTLVELLNDAHMALAPLSREEAFLLIQRTKAHTLISGFRGMPAINKDHLIDVLVNFSHLINDLDNILEVDINPFAIDEEGGVALDAHMLIK